MDTKSCPNCGTEIKEESERCPECNRPLTLIEADKDFWDETQALQDKIIPFEFTYGQPRVCVCIKCGRPVQPSKGARDRGIPETCSCNYYGIPYFPVEVDYPMPQVIINFRQQLYIYNELTLPHHIGDKSSSEFASYAKELKDQTDMYERKTGRKPVPEPPPKFLKPDD